MALFGDELAREVATLIRRRHQALGLALGGEPDGPEDAPAEPGSPLAEDLELLIGVANGSFHRTEGQVREVDRALGRLRELLLGNPLGGAATFPDAFWASDVGILFSRARWWVSGEDLITISNAAALAFGENTQANRMRIARAMDSGLLDWVPDPSVANPQQNRRVLRPQVERLRALSRLPE